MTRSWGRSCRGSGQGRSFPSPSYGASKFYAWTQALFGGEIPRRLRDTDELIGKRATASVATPPGKTRAKIEGMRALKKRRRRRPIPKGRRRTVLTQQRRGRFGEYRPLSIRVVDEAWGWQRNKPADSRPTSGPFCCRSSAHKPRYRSAKEASLWHSLSGRVSNPPARRLELFNWFDGTDYGLGLILGPMLCAVDFDTDDEDGGWASFTQQYPQFRTFPVRSLAAAERMCSSGQPDHSKVHSPVGWRQH